MSGEMDIETTPTMRINEKAVEALNYALDDLDITGTERFTLADFTTAVADLEGRVIKTCVSIIEKLNHYDGCAITLPTEDSCTIESIFRGVCASALEPGFDENAECFAYRFMHFLTTQIQAQRLHKHTNAGSQRREIAGKRGRVAFQLDKICRILDMSPSSVDEVSIVSEIYERVQEYVQSLPEGVDLNNPPRLIPTCDIPEEKRVTLERLSKIFHDDFSLRRSMLCQRLDVTIDSFLWGEAAQGKEGEIVAAIKQHRGHLTEAAHFYKPEDVFTAPVSLMYEHMKKVTDRGSVGDNIVKKIIIGKVPDRGGRANEMRPSTGAFRPERIGGGRGGGGRGGGGRGGGHKHQQHGNNKKNKNKGGNNSKSDKGRRVEIVDETETKRAKL